MPLSHAHVSNHDHPLAFLSLRPCTHIISRNTHDCLNFLAFFLIRHIDWAILQTSSSLLLSWIHKRGVSTRIRLWHAIDIFVYMPQKPVAHSKTHSGNFRNPCSDYSYPILTFAQTGGTQLIIGNAPTSSDLHRSV